MSESLPTLLISTKLVQSLKSTSDILRSLTSDVTPNLPSSLMQGALVMAVAAMEAGLSDSLKYYLRHFPAKLPKDHLRNASEVLPANVADLVAIATERCAVALGYKSFPDFIRQYERLLSIEISEPMSEELAFVQEVKATRNLLLHNALVVNYLYMEQAGVKRRAEHVGRKLKVDHAYVSSSISAVVTFIEDVITALSAKYAQYTKVAAHRRLWEYIFSSPVMPYDDYWKIDEDADKIVALKSGRYESTLSSTELLFLGVWRAHFNGDGHYLSRLDMRRFDSEHLRKFHFLLSIAPELPWC